LVSRHYKIMVHDDLVNRDNSQTREQIAKTIDWWKLAQSLLTHDGIEIIIGTRWDFDDLYGHIIDKFMKPEKDYSLGRPITELHAGKYHLIQMDCWSDPIAETGSTFPILFPEKRLKEIELEQADRFGGQYRNDPLAKGKNPFKRDWIRRWHDGDIPSVVNTIMVIDPSGKGQVDSDHSGMVVVDAGVDKKLYLRFGQRSLITDMALADWIIDTAILFQPSTIGIEDNKYFTMCELLEIRVAQRLADDEVAKKHNEYVRTIPYILTELKPMGRPKEVRIKYMTGFVEHGQVLFPMNGT